MDRFLSRFTGINGFLIIFVSALLLSCAGPGKFNQAQLLIGMEKTACYGQCPVYTLKIDSRGRGRFNGIENTSLTGEYAFRLNKKELEQLRTGFDTIGFFELEDRYYEMVTDLPTTYIRYRSGGKDKKIMDYSGAPTQLKKLEKQLESLVLSRPMKKIK